MNLRS